MIYTFWASIYNTAKAMFYDSSSSILTAKNVQDAIDELTTIASSGLPFTSLTDPALNAITQNIVDTKGGIVITLTGAGNDQTLPTPTDTSIIHQFTVINNDTSTNNIDIIGVITTTLQPGEKALWIYDGTAWITSEANGLWLDDGTNLKGQNSTRNIDVQTGKFKSSSIFEIFASGVNFFIKLVSVTGKIIFQLPDSAGVTSLQIKNFLGTVINEFFSDGTHIDGDPTEDSVVEFKTGSGDTLVKINTSDTAPATFENNGSEIGAAIHTATDYNPSALTQDRRIIFDNTVADRECVISDEDIAAGSPTKHRKFTIKDESGGADVHRIRIAGESGTIDGQAYVDINAPYGYIHLYTNGTNLFRE